MAEREVVIVSGARTAVGNIPCFLLQCHLSQRINESGNETSDTRTKIISNFSRYRKNLRNIFFKVVYAKIVDLKRPKRAIKLHTTVGFTTVP
jgi:hypothetical protein